MVSKHVEVILAAKQPSPERDGETLFWRKYCPLYTANTNALGCPCEGGVLNMSSWELFRELWEQDVAQEFDINYGEGATLTDGKHSNSSIHSFYLALEVPTLPSF